ELSEIEKKILMDLTRTNSIRKTAVNIFKDLSKRALIRKIIRRTLRILLEKNLIHVENTNKTLRSDNGD
ncbi:MAG: hypothetical protein QXE10_06360, partial [Desulfurococcaceae archaeon]